MKIIEYFNFYKNIKNKENVLKKFSLISRKNSIVNYLKQNKKEVINSINYCFFESNENILISVFSENNIYFIHINSLLIKDYPKNFNSINEYENYLLIYGTFAILLDLNFQAKDLDDSRILFKDFLHELTQYIFYDEKFNLNLIPYIDDENKIISFVYLYGYDFLFEIFKYFYKDKSNYVEIMKFLKMNESEFEALFELYKSKIILEDL